MKKGFVYSLICPLTNDIRYIGCTVKNTTARLRQHINEIKRPMNSYKLNWLRHLNSLGKLNELKIAVIEECDVEQLKERETYWINNYSNLLTNLTNTISSGYRIRGPSGYHHTEEAKRKIGEAASKAHLGRKASDTARANISKSLIGTKRRVGKYHTEEAKKKIGQTGKGRIPWNRRKVFQYTIDGTFIKEWNTVCEAEKELKIRNISMAARGLGYRTQAGGYVWKYEQ